VTRVAVLRVAFSVSMLLVVAPANAQSQRRPQQPGVKQPTAATEKPISREDQRGSEQSPLIVKIAPTPNTEDERAEETKERERVAQIERNKQKSDADIVKYTAQLAEFTKLLFYATGALVFATVGLLVFAGLQSRDTRRSIDLARAEFISSHRPLMKVKLVELVEVDGEHAGVRFTVVNQGLSTAHVTGSCAKADFFGDTDWLHPNDYGVDNTIPVRPFVTGAADTYTVHTVQPVGFISVHAGNDSGRLRFYGYIAYRDELENVRTTYFCRQYNLGADRFDPADRPDYDSAD
jgi:hypothetical protein